MTKRIHATINVGKSLAIESNVDCPDIFEKLRRDVLREFQRHSVDATFVVNLL